ncbi:hypothetical protein KO361_01455 [Candidatus Woesearchaeota archaeon]|nr:hypothetical protein [Candidatus Woesearchaeota archaeon]
MKKNKGQIALEFIITYGWAFLVMLVVIGAFFYFRMGPEQVVPPSCLFTDDLFCMGHKFNESGLILEMRNNAGRPVNITHISCQIERYDRNTTEFVPSIVLAPSDSSADIICTPDGIYNEPSLIRSNVVIYYKYHGQEFPRTTEGNVIGYFSD